MSESIKIKEGGIDRSQNQINKIKTNTSNGGVCYWVPETERQTDAKSITKNGTYTAETEGLYGYSVLNVNVSPTGGVSGKDSPGGGTDWNEYNVDVDDDGYLNEKEIPSAITVVMPPIKTTYFDGDTIDYTGIEVVALDAHGEVWQDENYPDGIIPFDELEFPTTTAHADGGEEGASSDLDTGSFTQPIPLSKKAVVAYTQSNVPKRNTVVYEPINNAVMIIMSNTETSTHLLFAATQQGYAGRNERTIVDLRTGEETKESSETYIDHSYTAHEKKVYYGILYSNRGTGLKDMVVSPVVNSYGDSGHAAAAAWTAIYGDIHGGSKQEVAVYWNRPGDSRQLIGSFEITVESVESGSAHGGENESGGFEGGGSEHGF